jgi:hypothetical protein
MGASRAGLSELQEEIKHFSDSLFKNQFFTVIKTSISGQRFSVGWTAGGAIILQ